MSASLGRVHIKQESGKKIKGETEQRAQSLLNRLTSYYEFFKSHLSNMHLRRPDSATMIV